MGATSKKKLILVPSKAMDGNKKKERNENKLIRMSARARTFMSFDDNQVEIWPQGGAEERKSSVLLDIFQAFTADINEVKKMVKSGSLKSADLNRIGFVTTKMYNRITGGKPEKNIWISAGVHDTVAGADPEFLLFDSKGNVMHAGQVGGMSKTTKIGYDGAMCEVRPSPATSPEGLVRNIKSCFEDPDLIRPIEKYDWFAGCYYKDSKRDYPMGGHIHVGNPAKVARMPMSKRELFFNVLNKIMDELVAIPCVRLDGDMGTKRRCNCSMGHFGYFGEWRNHNGRLEHRTLSGMWMLHPSLARAVLGTAKAVTDEVFKRWAAEGFDYKYIMPANCLEKYEGNPRAMNSPGFTSWKDFPVCKDLGAVMSSSEMKSALDSSKGGDITKSFLTSWHKNMKRLATYNTHSKYIDGLKEILSVPMQEILDWDRKIQTNWLTNKKFIVNV